MAQYTWVGYGGDARIAIVAWVLAIAAFLACASIYISHARHDPHLAQSAQAGPMSPITHTSVGIIFVIVLLVGRAHVWSVRLAGAAIAAMTAPMIFDLAFLALSPMVTVRKTALLGFASMLVVFAVWALFGFGYPSTSTFFALNVASKILAFVTALVLFFPDRTSARRSSSAPRSSLV